MVKLPETISALESELSTVYFAYTLFETSLPFASVILMNAEASVPTGIAFPSFALSNLSEPVVLIRAANPVYAEKSTAVMVTSPDSIVSISLPVVSYLKLCFTTFATAVSPLFVR